jgi:hypothetical protein
MDSRTFFCEAFLLIFIGVAAISNYPSFHEYLSSTSICSCLSIRSSLLQCSGNFLTASCFRHSSSKICFSAMAVVSPRAGGT